MKKKKQNIIPDYVKAARKGSREAEMEIMGPGFHSRHAVHRSGKTYTRKMKHRKGGAEE